MGSAVCVHADGYFLTNAHVIREADPAEIRLVLHANQPKERVVDAEVIRMDKELDLALLKVVGAGEITFTALAVTKQVPFETQQLTAFGFPFGKLLKQEDVGYPSMSINIGRITALRKRRETLERIQLDVVLNPGNSGGPVLNSFGELAGIVVSGVPGSGVNFAISANQVSGFLSRPLVEFHPPAIDLQEIHSPMAVTAVVERVTAPGDGPVAVSLELTDPDGETQVYELQEGDDGRFSTQIVPLREALKEPPVETFVTFPEGSISFLVPNQMIQVGDKQLRLGNLRQLILETPATAVDVDGTRFQGEIKDLERLRGSLGTGSPLDVSLEGARRLEFTQRQVQLTLPYRLVVQAPGASVVEQDGVFELKGHYFDPDESARVQIVNAVASTETSMDVKFQEERVDIPLPAEFSDVVAGGGGRFLILHLPSLEKLAVVDVPKAEIVKYIPLQSSKVLFAAGRHRLVILYSATRLAEVWNLDSLQEEKVKLLPMEGVILNAVMGYNSEGPLLLRIAESSATSARTRMAAVDPVSLDFRVLKQTVNANQKADDNIRMRASGNGELFGMWKRGSSPTGVVVASIDGQELRGVYQHESRGVILPSADGSFLATGRGLMTPGLKPFQEDPYSWKLHVPAYEGAFYIRVERNDNTQTDELHLRARGLSSNIRVLEGLKLGKDPRWNQTFPSRDKRIHWVPQGGFLAYLPESNQKVVVQKIDIDEEIKTLRVPYLFVASSPQTRVKKGDFFHYQIDCRSNAPLTSFELASGPEGMRLDSEGRLTWNVPLTPERTHVGVITKISTRDGRSLYHSFTLQLLDGE